VNAPQALPLLWVISTRPEPHLRQAVLSNFDSSCWWKEIPLDDADIDLYMHSSLRQIRSEFSYIIDSEAWPPTEAVHQMVRAAAGLFIYASTLMMFIGDGDLASPKAQLETILEFVNDMGDDDAVAARKGNPLKSLDDLYIQVLSRVHITVLPVTLQILGTVAFSPQLPALELANLLNLSQEMFYSALQRVYSVISVPSSEKASRDHLRFYHSSFPDFLKNRTRSGQFALKPSDIRMNFATACFQALSKTKFAFAKELPWKTTKPNPLSTSHYILSYAARNVWVACVSIDDLTKSPLLDVITNFNFGRLIFVKRTIPASSFRMFAEWLSKQV
jgi:hypothetical protein